MKLLGRKTDDVLIEYVGPDSERNYHSGGATSVEVKVVGTGSVQLQQNSSPILKSSSPTGPAGFAVDYLPDPTAWANVGGAVSGGAGVNVPISSTTGSRNFIRAVVAAEGEGTVLLRSLWS